MTKLFLKMKHWQIFALTVGIVFISQLIFMFNMFSSDRVLNGFSLYFFLIILIPFTILIFWFYTMGHKVNSILPADFKKNETFFKLSVLFPMFYIILVFLLFGIILSKTSEDFNPFLVIILIVPAHLFSMFCMFYLIYFCSKTLKTYELQKKVRFTDYAGEFVLLWFFPIGIWIIQPRINKIYDEHFIGNQNHLE